MREKYSSFFLETVCTICVWLDYKVKYILHVQNLLSQCVYILGETESNGRGSAGDERAYMWWSLCGLWSLSARKTNRPWLPEKAWSPGMLWNILFISIPGSTPSMASDGTLLCSHITASGPHQDAEDPLGGETFDRYQCLPSDFKVLLKAYLYNDACLSNIE